MTLNYTFPTIHNISDVLPHIDDCFRVVEKDELTFINYNMMGGDVFPPVVEGLNNPLAERVALRAAIRRECRGIVFDTKTGALVSRPYHKFFNVGEREDMLLEHIDISAPHVLLEKLDGSMIRPLIVDGYTRWGTKMGVTDVAMLAEEFVADKPYYYDLAEACVLSGHTPLFEFGSRRSRIVVDFPQDVMVLLDIRDNLTGTYMPRSLVRATAERHGVPVVDSVNYQGVHWPRVAGDIINLEHVLASVKESEEGEGKIIAWDNGHRAKIKSDHYVRIHRAKDMLRSERRVVDLILNEGLDDLLPILDAADRTRILNYVDSFHNEIAFATGSLQAAYDRNRRMFETKKDFATAKDAKTLAYPAWYRGATFTLWDGKAADERDVVLKAIRVGLQSETRFNEVKSELELRTKWDYQMEEAA
jgi:RNA ligase